MWGSPSSLLSPLPLPQLLLVRALVTIHLSIASICRTSILKLTINWLFASPFQELILARWCFIIFNAVIMFIYLNVPGAEDDKNLKGKTI